MSTKHPQIEAADIKGAIIVGLKQAWYKNFVMTDERDDDIAPEYLTTAAVCHALADYVDTHGLRGRIVVRAEEQTRVMWGAALWRALFAKRSRSGMKRESDRKGNVDISIALKRSIVPEPFAVVENKGFLKFTEDGHLYKGSGGEIEKDLKRNKEFVAECLPPPDGGVEYSAFTFYLRDKASVIKADAQTYCQEKERYFKDLAAGLVPEHPELLVDVEVNTLESELFDTPEAANATDEEGGCPAYVSDGTWHIVYGIISVYKPSVVVTNAKSLKSERSDGAIGPVPH